MNRRRFLTISGSAVLGSTTLQTITKQPSVALDFTVKSVPDAEPSNVEKMMVDFETFELKPRYLNNTGDEATLEVTMNMENHSPSTKSMNTKLENHTKITREDIQEMMPLQSPVSSNESALGCEI